jgi:hypothetical protein
MFLQKSTSKTFSKQIRKKRRQFFLDNFWFHRIFGCFPAMGVEKHDKKLFTKKSTKKSPTLTTGVADFCLLGGPLQKHGKSVAFHVRALGSSGLEGANAGPPW